MQTQSYKDENHILEQLAFPGKYFFNCGFDRPELNLYVEIKLRNQQNPFRNLGEP
jgi:hypothetical protein